jgi:hypothetical protein
MKYLVRDNQTGESFVYEGNAPPTESDILQQKQQGVSQQPIQPRDTSGGLGNIPFLGPMIRNITNYAQDVGQGLAGNPVISLAEKNANQANDLIKQAMAEKNPKRRIQLLTQAGQVAQTGSDIANQYTAGFSPDIKNPYVGRGFGTAANIAGLADIVGGIVGSPAAFGLPSSPNIIKRGTGFVKNLNPYQSLPAKMEKLVAKASESGDVVKTDDFIDAFKSDVKELYDTNAQQLPNGTWKWADPDIAEYVDRAEDYIRSLSSGTIEGEDYLDARKLLDLRRYFGRQSLLGETPKAYVADAARYTTTNVAKNITPGLARTDLLYSSLRKISGPNELSALKRMGITAIGLPIALRLLSNPLGNSGGSSAETTSAP